MNCKNPISEKYQRIPTVGGNQSKLATERFPPFIVVGMLCWMVFSVICFALVTVSPAGALGGVTPAVVLEIRRVLLSFFSAPTSIF